MTKKAAKLEIAQQPPAPPESPSFTLERIFELETYARQCLTTVLEQKQILKEAKEIYDGAVEELMNTIRKAHEPEFEFEPAGGKVDKKTGEILDHPGRPDDGEGDD